MKKAQLKTDMKKNIKFAAVSFLYHYSHHGSLLDLEKPINHF